MTTRRAGDRAVKYPPDKSFVLTKAEASRRHIEAAIKAFEEGRFDVAITLAGAAEGMAPETTAQTLYSFARDHPGLAAQGNAKKEWFEQLNVERNWLKHAGPNHAPAMEFDRSSAAYMLIRAIDKAQVTFGFQGEDIEFWFWTIKQKFE
jgi:hypothetical protein